MPTLEALRHTVRRDEHIPLLKQLIERQVGTVTFASLDVSGRNREWLEEWAEVIETI